MSASPNPSSSGTTVWIQGCGYDKSYPADLRIKHSAGYTETYGVVVWNTGA